ncbi:fumarate hydratase [Kosmotoga arenicorallina S304]|uniref:Fumarate hydratase n=1 Tax=Kosmotoga arenicorallina S304 TaxID=1453497 RepID=A0A176K2X3_9BACT|nr:fumarate hydratase [Kosmotoga arenicorallina]OAA31650.1 fumarate hydratase [Kosmotoga arenicorallina S304]
MIIADKLCEIIKSELIKANTIACEQVRKEAEKYKGPFSEIILENMEIAEKEKLPLCQDTGMVEFFAFIGHKVRLEEPLPETFEKAVRDVYISQPYRYSVVSDPLFERINTGDNTPIICHIFMVEGNKLETRFLIKGGGSENLSALFMLRPSSSTRDLKEIVLNHIKSLGANACPPLHVGIGIGGTSEEALLLSKLALTRGFEERNFVKEYSLLEEELLKEINALKLGYQGLGNGISAYSVNIEHYPTHIATLPVALSVDCYLHRKGSFIIEDS